MACWHVRFSPQKRVASQTILLSSFAETKSSQKTLKISRKELPRAHTGTPGTRAQGQWQAGSQGQE